MKYSPNAATATKSSFQVTNYREDYAWAVYVPSIHQDPDHIVMTIGELEAMAQEDAHIKKIAETILRPILRPIAVMRETCDDFSTWNVDQNYVSFDAFIQDSSVIIQNARIHAIAETLLESYPDSRSTTQDNVITTADAIRTFLETTAIKDAEQQLATLKFRMQEGKHKSNVRDAGAGGGGEQILAQQGPPDHERLALEAMTVIQTINGFHSRDSKALFKSIDSLREIFNRLKPSTDPDFRFQHDHQPGGTIYWNGMYRKWFYLLQKTPNTKNSTEQVKQYFNILNPDKGSDFFKRKIWVAMDPSLRERVDNNDITLTKAMSEF